MLGAGRVVYGERSDFQNISERTLVGVAFAGGMFILGLLSCLRELLPGPSWPEKWRATVSLPSGLSRTVWPGSSLVGTFVILRDRSSFATDTTVRRAHRTRRVPDEILRGASICRRADAYVPTWALTTGQAAALLTALPSLARTMVDLAIFSGLRRGELFALRWKDIEEHAPDTGRRRADRIPPAVPAAAIVTDPAVLPDACLPLLRGTTGS